MMCSLETGFGALRVENAVNRPLPNITGRWTQEQVFADAGLPPGVYTKVFPGVNDVEPVIAHPLCTE